MSGHKRNRLISHIGRIGIILGFVVIGLGIKAERRVPIFIGIGIFIFSVVAQAVISNVVTVADSVKRNMSRSSETAKATSKYHPLLADERTKQDPDIQRLLQYLSVQKAFFDPDYISSSAAQNDPYVRELMEVLDRMLVSRGINGDFGGYGNANSKSAYVTELNKREIEQRQREKNRPRRIVGTVLMTVGMVMFFIPFFAVLSNAFGGNSVFTFGAAPLGMMLAIIGSIIKK